MIFFAYLSDGGIYAAPYSISFFEVPVRQLGLQVFEQNTFHIFHRS